MYVWYVFYDWLLLKEGFITLSCCKSISKKGIFFLSHFFGNFISLLICFCKISFNKIILVMGTVGFHGWAEVPNDGWLEKEKAFKE